MPKLHDRTRRKICLTAFFALCILPALALLAWGVSRQGDWHVTSHARQLGRQLSLSASIEAVEHPRPGLLRYKGVRVANPETKATIFACRRVEACMQDVADGPRPALVLAADAAEVNGQQFECLCRILQDIMARRTSSEEVDVRLTIAELVLCENVENDNDVNRGPADNHNKKMASSSVVDSTWLRDVQLSLQTVAEGAQAELTFCNSDLNAVAGENNDRSPVQIAIRREAGTWQVTLVNSTFYNVDLDRLLGQRFPDMLTGRATVEIQHADFVDGRLQNAAGQIQAGPGTISRAFFDGASTQLLLPSRRLTSDPPVSEIAYERLSLGFKIDSEGLRIDGLLAPYTTPNGVVIPIVLSDTNGPLLGQPNTQPLPIVALLHALVPESRGQKPPSERTRWLSRRLPICEPVAGDSIRR